MVGGMFLYGQMAPAAVSLGEVSLGTQKWALELTSTASFARVVVLLVLLCVLFYRFDGNGASVSVLGDADGCAGSRKRARHLHHRGIQAHETPQRASEHFPAASATAKAAAMMAEKRIRSSEGGSSRFR